MFINTKIYVTQGWVSIRGTVESGFGGDFTPSSPGPTRQVHGVPEVNTNVVYLFVQRLNRGSHSRPEPPRRQREFWEWPSGDDGEVYGLKSPFDSNSCLIPRSRRVLNFVKRSTSGPKPYSDTLNRVQQCQQSVWRDKYHQGPETLRSPSQDVSGRSPLMTRGSMMSGEESRVDWHPVLVETL